MRAPSPAVLVFAALAWLMAALVVVQVFLAGLALMHDPAFWPWHVRTGNLLGFVPLVLTAVAFVARLGRGLGGWSVGLWFLIGLQHAFIDWRPSVVSALHVVNALAIFLVAVWLARRATARSSVGPTAVPTASGGWVPLGTVRRP